MVEQFGKKVTHAFSRYTPSTFFCLRYIPQNDFEKNETLCVRFFLQTVGNCSSNSPSTSEKIRNHFLTSFKIKKKIEKNTANHGEFASRLAFKAKKT